jgi:transposase
MRGEQDSQIELLTTTSPGKRVPATHPIREIKRLADQALAKLNPVFDAMYSSTGRPSIPPERLLTAQLLIALYSVRSERQFCERLDYELLFRFFLDMNLDDASWDATTFTKNRDRLVEHEVARQFFEEVVRQAKKAGLVSAEHFTVADFCAPRGAFSLTLCQILGTLRHVTGSGCWGVGHNRETLMPTSAIAAEAAAESAPARPCPAAAPDLRASSSVSRGSRVWSSGPRKRWRKQQRGSHPRSYVLGSASRGPPGAMSLQHPIDALLVPSFANKSSRIPEDFCRPTDPHPIQFGHIFDTKADAYRSLIGGGFVVPGSASTSTLSLLLTTTVIASRMPLRKPMLSPTLIGLVDSWINAGALDN